MSALSTVIVHHHASVQALILKILAQAGITSAVAMASVEAALGHINQVAVDLLLLDVHACRAEPHLANSVVEIRDRYGTRVGLMAGHRDDAMPPVPHDFVLRKPFGSADLWMALGHLAGTIPSREGAPHPLQRTDTSYRYCGLDDDWRPIAGVPIQETLILRDRLGGTCVARFESVLAYRVLEGRLMGAPIHWRWTDDR
jgi:CheY-like chemotaxis protein